MGSSLPTLAAQTRSGCGVMNGYASGGRGEPVPEGATTALELARRSQAAVTAKDRAAWLSLFAPDAVLEDPIGPSPLDPGGAGHRGLAAIAAFYDTVIAPSERIIFEIERSFL